MKIDAHHHLWDLNAVEYPWIMDNEPRFFGDHAPIRRDYLLPEFTKDARAKGFEGSVHIQVGAADPMVEARWVQSLSDANPDWPMAQVVFCDLTSDTTREALDQYRTLNSVRGVRQIVGRSVAEDAATGTNDLLDNPAFLAGLKMAAEQGLSFDLQLIPELMEKTARVLAQVPEISVALCHAGSPHDRTKEGLEYWTRQLKYLSARPNVMCKFSGLGMFDHDWTAEKIKPIVDTALTQFGPERCMFGSNFPVDSLSSSYETLVDAYHQILGQDDQVFGLTAKRFYDIK